MKTLSEITEQQRRWSKATWDYWEARVQWHERNGQDRSDAQGAADVDLMYERTWDGTTGELITGKTSTTHTPGPWAVAQPGTDDDYTKHRIVYQENPGTDPDRLDKIAQVYCWGSCSNRDATAALIAAAPELLAACKYILGDLRMPAVRDGEEGVTCGAIAALEKAIAKAEGGQQ